MQDAEREPVLTRRRAGLGAEPPDEVGADEAVLMFAEQILEPLVPVGLRPGGPFADDRLDRFGGVESALGPLSGAVQ